MTFILYSVFIISLFIPIYSYALYPLIMRLLPGKKYAMDDTYAPGVSVLVAAYNEDKHIAARVRNLEGLDYPADKIEILIGSDGSTDDTYKTALAARSSENTHVFDFERGGKVNALNALIARARGDILVFTDANCEFDNAAIRKLARHFADERVGCVSGIAKYIVTDASGHGAVSESAYFRYETYVKSLESRAGTLTGSFGAIYAIRRGIFDKIKPGIVNDDMYVTMRVLSEGYATIQDTEAIAYEAPDDELKSQFKRHKRMGAGHYQTMAEFKRMLIWRRGSFAYISHRVLKWLVPFFMIALLLSNIALAFTSRVMLCALCLQALSYTVIALYYALCVKSGRKPGSILGRALSMLLYFVSVNISLLCGFFSFITGKQKATWETSR